MLSKNEAASYSDKERERERGREREDDQRGGEEEEGGAKPTGRGQGMSREPRCKHGEPLMTQRTNES